MAAHQAGGPVRPCSNRTRCRNGELVLRLGVVCSSIVQSSQGTLLMLYAHGWPGR